MTDTDSNVAVRALAAKAWWEEAHGDVVLLSDATDAIETALVTPTTSAPVATAEVETLLGRHMERMGGAFARMASGSADSAPYTALAPTPAPVAGEGLRDAAEAMLRALDAIGPRSLSSGDEIAWAFARGGVIADLRRAALSEPVALPGRRRGYGLPCQADPLCFRLDGHEGDHIHPDEPKP